jgi:acyl-coenzyme A thioesterase PaaI-like protein
LAAAPLITIEQFNALMRAEIPLSTFLGITALEVGAGSAVLRLPFTPAALRPGGAQSGPADGTGRPRHVRRGHGPLRQRTARLEQRPVDELSLLGRCSVLGLGSKRALAKTEIVPEVGDGRLVCLVTANYSLPSSI